MTDLIPVYTLSCRMAERQIAVLNETMKNLKKIGGDNSSEIDELKRRIRILYTERAEMREIISALTSYAERENADE
ncbi:MAG: hypothetical protein IKI94_07870 [Ruminococcus sp.]|jgi:hypothetical protein|nr:hypothetical protein [Ruminococcus sp.]